MPTTRVLDYGDRGDAVAGLQRLLNESPFRAPRRRLAVDGEFGPLTASACQQAKYWAGYRREDLKPYAGPRILALLSGEQLPTPEMRAPQGADREGRGRRGGAAAAPARPRARAPRPRPARGPGQQGEVQRLVDRRRE